MKNKTRILFVALSMISAMVLPACEGSNVSSAKEEEPIPDYVQPERPFEIGDTVKEWSSRWHYDGIVMGAQTGDHVEIADDFGQEDDCSLKFEVRKNSGYISTDLVEDIYFHDDCAKNGDIISLYYYLPAGSNIASLQLQAVAVSGRNQIDGEKVLIDSSSEEKWVRAMLSYDILDALGSIRLAYTTVNAGEDATIYVDDVSIVYGEETVETKYDYNEESLWETYEDYFKVGTCMSSSMLNNTKLREITRDNFNSVTAENEGKPEQILDQKACQELLKESEAEVAITTKPFEKLYNWAEANHIGVRHHTFVWYSQTPSWFFTTDYTNNGPKASKDLMLLRMENFIRVTLETINERWPGLVYAIDVANEAIENANYRTNNNNWYSTVGKDFVYYAMKYAHEYKEEYQELYYNDYSFDYDTRNCSFAVNTLLKEAIEEELVDGVGIQGHIDSNANLENVMTDAKMIKEKGLKCQITELDITINNTNESSLEQQKKAYKDLTVKILENNAEGLTDINALVMWGICDNQSWKSNQNPLLFTREYEKKPAYYGVLEALDSANI